MKHSKTLPLVLCCAVSAAALVCGARPHAASAAPRFETRCGWFSNPTPANISLYDRDGEWVVGVQGGHQVEGDWPWPSFKPGQWVETNGSHGYGCVCMRLRADKETGRVLEIESARARPLSVCARDRSLKKWKRMLD